jgi:2-polyprenyl-3-methyl-5-hydroxy-6-metoxy-1,4-benzoquinol methylase
MKRCVLCESLLEKVVASVDAKTTEPLDVRMCLSCGLVQQTPLPTDEALRAYYTHHYRTDYKNTYRPKSKHVFRAGVAARDRLEFLASNLRREGVEVRGMTHLDVGAGGGEVVFAAHQLGLQSMGIEPNEGYSEFAREAYGIEVQTGELADVRSKRFQIVTMFHVLEHMPNPKGVFEALYEIIAADGYALLEVPNIEQADASPANIFFKAHLIYYSSSTLLLAAGRWFTPVKISDKGNLRILLKRRSTPAVTSPVALQADVDRTSRRLQEKGWFEYLFVGGGWRRPFQRVARISSERGITRMKPLDVLNLALRQR